MTYQTSFDGYILLEIEDQTGNWNIDICKNKIHIKIQFELRYHRQKSWNIHMEDNTENNINTEIVTINEEIRSEQSNYAAAIDNQIERSSVSENSKMV